MHNKLHVAAPARRVRRPFHLGWRWRRSAVGGGRGGNRVQLAGSVSLCHARGISQQITQRENYSDAFRCPLSRAAPRVLLRRRAGRQSGCDRLRLNARGGAFSRTCRSLLDDGLISHFHALPSALPIKPSIHKKKKKRENTFANVTKKKRGGRNERLKLPNENN